MTVYRGQVSVLGRARCRRADACSCARAPVPYRRSLRLTLCGHGGGLGSDGVLVTQVVVADGLCARVWASERGQDRGAQSVGNRTALARVRVLTTPMGPARLHTLRSASSSYTRGTPVGMLSLRMASSDMSSRYLTSARSEFPCAAMMTRLPLLMVGAIVSCQIGRKRATVSFSDSLLGTSAGSIPVYLRSFPGKRSSDSSSGGGGVS